MTREKEFAQIVVRATWESERVRMQEGLRQDARSQALSARRSCLTGHRPRPRLRCPSIETNTHRGLSPATPCPVQPK